MNTTLKDGPVLTGPGTYEVIGLNLERGFGFVRINNSRVFFHVREVVSQYRDRWDTLMVGHWIYVAKFVVLNGFVECSGVELFSQEELQKFDQDSWIDVDRTICNNVVERTIPALPTFEASPAPSSPLLSSANRNRTLLEIILENKNAKK